MSSPSKGSDFGSPRRTQDPGSATIAPFSPLTTTARGHSRDAVLVQQNSPLLIATPPQITRALAFSHPFLLPLNKLLGLVSWSSGDPWESFLVVGLFWTLVLYGSSIIRWAGPTVMVTILITGIYARRYSPLSGSATIGERVKGQNAEHRGAAVKHQKSLDEIVDILNSFTSRCNILLDPLLDLTDFLSTQNTTTSTTTRPALRAFLIRILMVTPLWVALTIPPLNVITVQRVILAVGTLMLSWHSRPARVSRAILWRSMTVRYVLSIITGLNFANTFPAKDLPPPLPPRNKSQIDIASSLASSERSVSTGVRFTFTIYENQRRWLALGWTSSLFAYERAPWTDEHLNALPSKEDFTLPKMEHNVSQWQWVRGSDWRCESVGLLSPSETSKSGGDGWIYYDNKWNDGRKQDGWGRYTRRRKWYRDAELVDNIESMRITATELPAAEVIEKSAASSPGQITKNINPAAPSSPNDVGETGSTSIKRRGFFRRNSKTSTPSSAKSSRTLFASDEEQDTPVVPERVEREGDWNVGDNVKMELG
ncbi:peroxisome- protein [Lambiella insularis]|nr:peroxisome- protein [Lambiella insularis]